MSRIRPPDAAWVLPEPPDAALAGRLAAELQLPRSLCSVLVRRGITAPEDAKRFLRPRLDHLHDAAELADGPRAADRIARAISAGEPIVVHGDYDVDGICATALLTRWLRSLGGSVVPFVPHISPSPKIAGEKFGAPGAAMTPTANSSPTMRLRNSAFLEFILSSLQIDWLRPNDAVGRIRQRCRVIITL